jgi:hypothetical protein
MTISTALSTNNKAFCTLGLLGDSLSLTYTLFDEFVRNEQCF